MGMTDFCWSHPSWLVRSVAGVGDVLRRVGLMFFIFVDAFVPGWVSSRSSRYDRVESR